MQRKPANEARKQAQQNQLKSSKKPFIKSILPVALLAGIAAIGGSFLLLGPGAADTDDLTTSQIIKREKAFKSAGRAAFPVVDLDNSEELDKATASMHLPLAQKRQLAKDLQSGKTTLVWVKLFDDLAEDGDVVQFSSGQFAIQVPLRHAPTVFAVPMNTASTMSVTGITDGGGGITLGLETSTGVVTFPVLAVGETISLGVSK